MNIEESSKRILVTDNCLNHVHIAQVECLVHPQYCAAGATKAFDVCHLFIIIKNGEQGFSGCSYNRSYGRLWINQIISRVF